MKNFLTGFVQLGAGAHLQQATGIRGDDGRRVRACSIFHFLRKEFQRRRGLRDVVNSCRAAADVRVR